MSVDTDLEVVQFRAFRDERLKSRGCGQRL
jgi:hypothetical protein